MPRIEVEHVRQLGSGGFGQVYESKVPGIQGHVAVKELVQEDPESLARFRREVRILERLQHQNVVRVLTSELDSAPYWFAMPLASGSVADELQQLAVNPHKVETYFIQILKGVEHIHAQKQIHRDLKPQNVLVYKNRLCVSDFGLGKSLDSARMSTVLTHNDKGWGTIHYAAPEQLQNFKTVDHRADIYPLGKILFHMLTNELPYPTVPLHLVEDKYRYIIGKCTKDDPAQRFSSATELIEEFATVTDNSQFAGLSETENRLSELFAQPVSDEIAETIRRILIQNSENQYLFHKFFPALTPEHLDYLLRAGDSGFLSLLTMFDTHVSGWLDFDFCDVVSDFYRCIAPRSQNLDIHRIVLTRLLVMGGLQNRWYVMDAFCDILLSIEKSERSKTMIAKQVIEANPDEFRKTYAEKSFRIDNADIPIVLKETIRQIV